jgi:ribonuclease HI
MTSPDLDNLPRSMEQEEELRDYHRRLTLAQRKDVAINDLKMRPFCGTVHIPSFANANRPDELQVEDIKAERGTAAVFWTDASVGRMGKERGLMAASVVWDKGNHTYEHKSIPLGRAEGNASANDAEIVEIAGALEIARSEVETRGLLTRARIFSDCLWPLEDLKAGPDRTIRYVGADVEWDETRFPLHRVFYLAEWLQGHGVVVELVWIKGHGRSRGNEEADRVAGEVMRRQVCEPEAREWREWKGEGVVHLRRLAEPQEPQEPQASEEEVRRVREGGMRQVAKQMAEQMAPREWQGAGGETWRYSPMEGTSVRNWDSEARAWRFWRLLVTGEWVEYST